MSGLRRYLILCLTLTILLVGCNSETTTTTPTDVEVVATQPAAPTEPSEPTEVVANPTEAPAATEPPVATEAPAPTEVPVPTEVPAPTEAAMPEMPSLSPADAVRAAMLAQGTGGPYHVESTSTSDGSTILVSADVIPPNQIRSTLTFDGFTQQIVITDGQMWMNQGDGWSEPVSGEMIAAALEQFITNPDSLSMTIGNEQFAGVDALDGKPTWLYTYDQAFSEMDSASQVKLWVEIATGLPLRTESSGVVLGSETVTTQAITYDSTITISPPQ
jgi:hypothetical protein